MAAVEQGIPRPRNKDVCLGPHAACSKQITMHYSFDFAQQLQFPNDPLQPGAVYFKSLRKCGLFGVSCEALSKQVNYLIDESVACGKGANTVISLIDHFLDVYGLGEVDLHLHADNCSGQNKNSAMLHYLLWRVLQGLNQSITLSFLIAGHTKFAPDRGFGLIKRVYRKTKIDCLEDIRNVVKVSSDMNDCQLVGHEDGQVIVQTHDWTDFCMKSFKKLDGILQFQHFRFTKEGVVYAKMTCDGEESAFPLLKKGVKLPLSNEKPPVIKPPGLPLARQWYLFDEIRQFVSPEYQDTVAPKPTAAKASNRGPSTEDTENHPSDAGHAAGAAVTKVRGRGRGRGAAKKVLETQEPNIEPQAMPEKPKRGRGGARGARRGRGRGKE